MFVTITGAKNTVRYIEVFANKRFINPGSTVLQLHNWEGFFCSEFYQDLKFLIACHKKPEDLQ